MKSIKGIAASHGYAIGPAFVYNPQTVEITDKKVENTQAEWQRLADAVNVALKQLEVSYANALKEVGEETAAIFEAHMEMLGDPELLDTAKEAILEEFLNAEAALHRTAEAFAVALEGMDDEYFQARAADIRDVAHRVVCILNGVDNSQLFSALKEPSVILAPDLTPSDTINLDKSLVLGFCTGTGGPTSHTAILARTLGLPAIVGAGMKILELKTGDSIILDGKNGDLIINADTSTLDVYKVRQENRKKFREEALKIAKQPATTTDGRQVEVVANVGSVEESVQAIEQGAEGVGLLRTEFVYLGKDHLPDEDEQYQAYKSILDVFGQRPVVLRTLDIGGDKELPYLKIAPETNPFLGVRAIRLCMQQPELFKPQLRAILRSGFGHNLKVMFPMIATVPELRAAKKLMQECRAELEEEGKPLPEKMEIGIMIEIPSAVMLADHLAKEVDFFSIGTNDLTQYTMAADRTNPGVSYLNDALSPAVLRLVARAIEEAHKAGIWIGMCGELAGEPTAIPILLGLGLDEFSMNAPAVPLAKYIIRSLSYEKCQQIAKKVLEMCSCEEVVTYVQKELPITNQG